MRYFSFLPLPPFITNAQKSFFPTASTYYGNFCKSLHCLSFSLFTHFLSSSFSSIFFCQNYLLPSWILCCFECICARPSFREAQRDCLGSANRGDFLAGFLRCSSDQSPIHEHLLAGVRPARLSARQQKGQSRPLVSVEELTTWLFVRPELPMNAASLPLQVQHQWWSPWILPGHQYGCIVWLVQWKAEPSPLSTPAPSHWLVLHTLEMIDPIILFNYYAGAPCRLTLSTHQHSKV